jgi:hypothetical protein
MVRNSGRTKRAVGLISLVVLGLSSAGCGGRQAQIVPVSSALDDQLTCTHLQGELNANISRFGELTQERSNRTRDSVGMALFVSPLFVDLSDTERREAAALEERNARLRSLAAGRGCRLDPA